METRGIYEFWFNLSIGIASDPHERWKISDIGYTPEQWDALTDEQREVELNDAVGEWANNYIEYSWSSEE